MLIGDYNLTYNHLQICISTWLKIENQKFDQFWRNFDLRKMRFKQIRFQLSVDKELEFQQAEDKNAFWFWRFEIENS